MTTDLYEACRQAIHLISPTGEMMRAGRAALFIMEQLGYPSWAIELLRRPPFIGLIEWGYDLVAKNRTIAAKLFFTTEDGAAILDRNLQFTLVVMALLLLGMGFTRWRYRR